MTDSSGEIVETPFRTLTGRVLTITRKQIVDGMKRINPDTQPTPTMVEEFVKVSRAMSEAVTDGSPQESCNGQTDDVTFKIPFPKDAVFIAQIYRTPSFRSQRYQNVMKQESLNAKDDVSTKTNNTMALANMSLNGGNDDSPSVQSQD